MEALGGGGGSSGGDEPTPTPPAPTVIQPLTITQIGSIDLSKTAGHKIWYMKITNPNDTAVSLYGFDFDTGSNTPVNPTKYALKYSNSDLPTESAGVVDCLGLISSISGGTLDLKKIPAGQQCIFKFDAQWDVNTSSQKNYPFKMKYTIYSDSTAYVESFARTITNTYIESSVCTSKPAYPDFSIGATVCLPNNQNMSFSINTLSQQADDFAPSEWYSVPSVGFGCMPLYMSNFDGSSIWDNASNYSILYESTTNTYTKTMIGSGYNIPLVPGWACTNPAVNKAGTNIYSLNSDKNGVISPIQLFWIYGLDGEVYGYPRNVIAGENKIYKIDQNTNLPVAILNIPDNETLVGVSKNSNFILSSGSGTNSSLICRLKNNYASSINLKMSANIQSYDIVDTNTKRYYLNGFIYGNDFRIDLHPTNYYTISNVNWGDWNWSGQGYDYVLTNSYKIDIDKCSVESDNYVISSNLSYSGRTLAGDSYTDFRGSLNTRYGIINYWKVKNSNYESGGYFIESYNAFTNGLDGQ